MNKRRRIKIIIADGNELFRKELTQYLESGSPDISVIGYANNDRELLRMLDVKNADVVLFDCANSSENLNIVIPRIQKAAKGGKLLIINSDPEDYLEYSINCGAAGFYDKKEIGNVIELTGAIKTILNDETAIVVNQRI